MAISSISDLLALSWAHAYCTEGPAFVAPAATASGLHVGSMSLDPGGPPTVTTWPDEIATDDLTQSTPADRPLYAAADADFNGKPIVYCPQDGIPRWMATGTFTDLGKDFEVVCVAKYIGAVGHQIIGGATHWGLTVTPGPNWMLYDRSGGGNLVGSTADTDLHYFRGVFADAGFLISLYIDETLDAQQIWGNDAHINSLVALSTDWDGVAIAFIGIADNGALSAGNRSDMRSFFQSHYGTP